MFCIIILYFSSLSLLEGTTIPSKKTIAPALRTGFAELSSNYDQFIVDQWGVLHDGKVAYDGTIDCMHNLVNAGKKVVKYRESILILNLNMFLTLVTAADNAIKL